MDKWLRNTNVVKVVALAIGIMLWVVVHLDVKTTDTATAALRNTTISNVMVQAVYDETQYAIVSIEPSEVTVTLKGDESKIRQLNPGNLKIVADLSKLPAGTYEELPVTTDSPLPKGVTLEIVPNKVKVVMEEKKMKEIPVQIDVTGKPVNGYRAGQPNLNPGRVYISAPASKIENAVVARAEVNVEGAKTNVVKKVKLTAYDKSGNEVKGAISPPVLEVEIPVTLPLKSMPLQIKWIGQPARGYAVSSFQQSVEQVTVYAQQDVLDKMDYYEGVEIDINGIREDKVYSVEIPVKNKEIQVEPAKVEVRVSVVPSVTKVLDQIPVTLSAPKDGLAAKLISPVSGRIAVTVEGAPNAVDKLRSQDLQALVNVSNLAAGTYDLPINVTLPPFVKRMDPNTKASVELITKLKIDNALPPPMTAPTSTAATATPSPSVEPATATPAPPSATAEAEATPAAPSSSPSPASGR